MLVHNFTEKAEEGQPFWRLLLSDLHIGSPHSAHDEIISYLERAKQLKARVLINGDVFDAIGPKDKRFDLACLHPDVARCKDLSRAIVQMAHKLLAPYSENIDIIGIGNHEETWIDHGYNDPVRMLIEALNRGSRECKDVKVPHVITHGSFTGWINTKFVVDGTKKRPRHKLYYLHGSGGDSPVTKGTIDFNRKGRSFSYDALTFGHKHNIVCSVEAIADITAGGRFVERDQLNLQTGSFYKNYQQYSDESALDYSYATRKGHSPKPRGGLWLCMRPTRAEGTKDEWEVKQDYATDVVPPWVRKRASAKAEA